MARCQVNRCEVCCVACHMYSVCQRMPQVCSLRGIVAAQAPEMLAGEGYGFPADPRMRLHEETLRQR